MGIDLEVIATVVGFGVVILYRIECLGRQIGAVDASIRSDVAPRRTEPQSTQSGRKITIVARKKRTCSGYSGPPLARC
jgi:hypothetical protein